MSETATFAAGCFWGVESAFMDMTGVIETAVGYTGGDFEIPSYEDVCAGVTNHAEALQIIFNPDKISYPQLLEKFFEIHNPTQINRQGPDIGTQYRSAIFCHSDMQIAQAQDMIARLNQSGRFKSPIATQIEPATTFWRAEEYHQKYFTKRGGGGCHV